MISSALLFLHVFFGTVALAGGAIAIFSRKGKKSHRTGGKMFTLSMVTTAMTAIVLSFIRPNDFLLAIGFFTIYLTCGGWVWAARLALKRKLQFHYLIAVFGLCSGLFLLATAFGTNSLSLVLLVFGGIQITMVGVDLVKPVKPNQYLAQHISKIGGAYIAAVTAFLVVNITFLPGWLLWFAPTVVGSFLITLAIGKTRRASTPEKAAIK